MWPMRLEMNRDECRKCLRCLELDAYGSMVSVLRAQGPFTNEKQKLLQELAKILHISNERHRAEVRRAVNDEKLATIAEQLNGPNTGTDWTIEGRRTIPLLPRLNARSTFTTLANSLSLATAVANEKKPDRYATLGWPTNLTAAETESPFKAKVEESLSTDTNICTLENELDNNKNFYESSREDERIDNKDVIQKDAKKISRISEKRKSPSPLPMANKVLVVSPGSLETLNHTITDKVKSENNDQVPQATTHQNIKLIPFTVNDISVHPSLKENTVISENSGHALISSNEHIGPAIPICISNSSKPKSIVTPVQNKVNTKVAPIVSSETLNISLNKVLSESKDVRLQDDANNVQKSQRSENTSSHLSCIKQVATMIHTNTKSVASKPVLSNNMHRVMAMQPGTTVSSGPGPPQIKQASPILAYKKWPSEQIATFNPQSTAKMSVTINSKKAINIPHRSNTKLTAKTNVIVIQKGHAKGVTLSHAGKEVLGKVIMGGKNLCVTNQHNASSVSVLPHHISLNGEQTTTLPTINTSNTESVKTNIKPGNTIVFNLRQDILEKNKILSHRFDSPGILNSEPKTVIQSKYTRFPMGDCNSDANTIDRESSRETDSVITSTMEEKQHRKSINTNMNSQVINSLNSSKVLEIKEILVRPQQLVSTPDDAGNDIQMQDSNEDTNVLGAKFDSTNLGIKDLQYLETVIVNHMDEHNDS